MSVHLSDSGNVITITVTENGAAVDISLATTKTIRFKLPDATTSDKTAAFTTDGTDGKIYYTVATGFLTPAGPWQCQAILTFASALYHSDIGEFQVGSNL